MDFHPSKIYIFDNTLKKHKNKLPIKCEQNKINGSTFALQGKKYAFKLKNCEPRRNTYKSYLSGFTLIELITVISGLSILTYIAAMTFQDITSDFENDEVQSHLNSLAAECLKTHASMAGSQNEMKSPASVDTTLLNKNNYEESAGNTCKYFQINPKDSSSKTHFSMGFGIAYGKVTKFAIKDSANTPGIITACNSWAGEGNCLANGSDYSLFYKHMDDVRIARATCNINLRDYMASTPNPANGGNKTTWDSEADKHCKNKILPTNATSYSTTNCKTNGCTKNVKIKGGKIVGYSDSDYNQAQTIECSNSISAYINSGSYNGGAEERTDLSGCTGTKYICDYREHGKISYESCKIQDAISKCQKDLDNKRQTENGQITVSGDGLPPCGQKFWVCDKVIYETPCPS